MLGGLLALMWVMALLVPAAVLAQRPKQEQVPFYPPSVTGLSVGRRQALAVGAVLCAAPFFYLAWAPLRNVFDEYPDNASWAYLLFALLLASPGLALTFCALRFARGSSKQE